MKAALIKTFGEPDVIELSEVSTPEPENNEVQIEVAYAGINPVDWKICEGLLKDRLPHEFPIILGWDVSGKISKVGAQVSADRIGEKVFAYARKPIVKMGSYAEFICLEASTVVKIPKNINLKEAASIPLSGLTAWQALIETAKLQKNETVLIHAGAGGVGTFAIQFAKYCGAYVITTASEKNRDYVQKLGADLVIDYKKTHFAEKIKQDFPHGIDVVFDTMGGKTLEESYPIVAKGGRLVSIVSPLTHEHGKKFGIQTSYVFVRPDSIHLKAISDLLLAGKVVPPHIEEYPLEKASVAVDQVKKGHTRGKVVLKVK